MGSFLARRKESKAYDRAHAEWEVRTDFLRTAVAAVTQIKAGQSAVDPGLSLKTTECALWSAPATLIEPRRGPGHYSGGSRGVSFRVAKGVYYRVGASRGTYQPGGEVQTPTDSGYVTATNQRIVFVGARAVREWSFSKLLSLTADPTGALVMMAVSNRQRVSGVRAPNADLWIELAGRIADTGPISVLNDLNAELQLTPEPAPPEHRPVAEHAVTALPGWYAAEGDTPGQLRWWDGRAWTTTVRVP